MVSAVLEVVVVEQRKHTAVYQSPTVFVLLLNLSFVCSNHEFVTFHQIHKIAKRREEEECCSKFLVMLL
jgi:hypothetical protein